MPGDPLTRTVRNRMASNNKRNGPWSLFAALNVAAGEVLDKTAPRHTNVQFVAFLTEVVSAQPARKELHVICDNVSSHKTDVVQIFLANHTNVSIHYTPNVFVMAQSGRELVCPHLARRHHARDIQQHPRPRQEAHALHPSIQQAGCPIEVEVFRFNSTNPVQFIRFNGLENHPETR